MGSEGPGVEGDTSKHSAEEDIPDTIVIHPPKQARNMAGERVPLLVAKSTIVQMQYDSTEEVTLRLPRPRDESEDEPHHPHSINIDEPAPKSYVCLGYTFSIIAGFCFTSCNVGIKFAGISIEVSAWQMLLVRCLSQLILMLPLIWWTKSDIFGAPDFATRWRIAAQAIVGGFLLLSIFEAVERLPIGDCTAIFFSNPAFTLILSAFLLRDHCGLYRTMIGSVLVAGVVIISRPPALFPSQPVAENNNKHQVMKEPYDLIGLGFALAVPILSAWIAIITREARHVHYSVLVFWFAVGGLFISVIGIFAIDTDPLFHSWTATTWVLCSQQAALGIVGSMLMTKATCWVSPSKVMVIRSFQIIISYIIQVEFFNTVPHMSDLFGAACIVFVVFFIGLEDRIMQKVDCRFM